MSSSDQLQRFIFDGTPVRGQWVNLDASWRKALENLDVEPFARDQLGQALAAVCLLASTLKIDGSITLQIRGQGAIHLLVAQARSDNSLRGLVRQNSRVRDESAALSEIFEAERMVITIDSGKGKPHQGIVPLTGHSIAEALEAYFEHSEQLPTRLWLAADESSAAGILLQRLPSQEDSADADAWDRTSQLASTVQAEELLRLPAEEVLYRLFHEEELRLFEPAPLRFQCGCSAQRTRDMIRSLGVDEARSILQEQGAIEVHCEFCNAEYRFDSVDVEQLFYPDAESGNQTVH